MAIKPVIESASGNLYLVEVDGKVVGEVDILVVGRRRFATLRLPTGKVDLGEVDEADTRTDEELAGDAFFTGKVGPQPAFRRKP